jgi:2-polyprenyl-3-methyl-5-hydroxy-6-metoxy-1,4-benzoquinol methylase
MRGLTIVKDDYIRARSAAAERILHVGCTRAPETIRWWEQGGLLHKQLCDQRRPGQRIVGVDIDEESLAWLRERMPGEDLRYADAQRLPHYLGDEKFDLIIAGDVIEHLPNPGQFLEGCREILAPNGAVLVTTVNAFGVSRFAKALLFHEAVHPEHTAYYSHRTLSRLCMMCGLRTSLLGYYRCEPATKFSLNLYVTNFLERAVAPVWPQFSEGVLMEAVVVA